jgi:Ca2+-binding EF-hand superfamily protein
MALRRFRVGGKEQRELTKDQEQDINEAFELVDADGLGSIDSEELKAVIGAVGIDPKNQETLNMIFDVDDGSGNGE